MHLESTVVVRKPRRWCRTPRRCLKRAEVGPGCGGGACNLAGPRRNRKRVDTLPYPRHPGDGEEWGRMSYRVTEWDRAGRSSVVKLISSTGNARFFGRRPGSSAWSPHRRIAGRVLGRLHTPASLCVSGAPFFMRWRTIYRSRKSAPGPGGIVIDVWVARLVRERNSRGAR